MLLSLIHSLQRLLLDIRTATTPWSLPPIVHDLFPPLLSTTLFNIELSKAIIVRRDYFIIHLTEKYWFISVTLKSGKPSPWLIFSRGPKILTCLMWVSLPECWFWRITIWMFMVVMYFFSELSRSLVFNGIVYQPVGSFSSRYCTSLRSCMLFPARIDIFEGV